MKRWFVVSIAMLAMIKSNLLAAQPNIHWTNIAYLSINSATLEKTSVGTDWIAGVISQAKSFSDCSMEFKFYKNKYAVMGFSADNTSAGIMSIDYGIYVHINRKAYIHETNNGRTYPGTSNYVALPYTAGIVYKKNGNIFYATLTPSTKPLHGECSFMQDRASTCWGDKPFPPDLDIINLSNRRELASRYSNTITRL